ncbi:MAG TPA: DegV family protein [Tissierellaceae bacterium]|nr:DegV family protein [Tissierellaceae bacterium]
MHRRRYYSFPNTSQPSTGDFYKVFEESLKEYDEIIAILLSSKISGTFNSAVLAKNMLNKKITVIDSKNAVANLRFLVEDAINMIKDNRSSKEITAYIKKKRDQVNIYLTTDTLEYLKKRLVYVIH